MIRTLLAGTFFFAAFIGTLVAIWIFA